MSSSRFLTFENYSLERCLLGVAVRHLPRPLSILDRCERNVANGGGAGLGGLPLIARSSEPNWFYRYFLFLFRCCKCCEGQIQLRCGDLFHVPSVARSGRAVTRQVEGICHV